MNREIRYIRQRIEWLKDLEKELGCYIRQIEDKLRKVEKHLNTYTSYTSYT